MFLKALFIIAKRWRQPSVHQVHKQHACIHPNEYYSDTKRNEVRVTMWMNLKNIELGEVSNERPHVYDSTYTEFPEQANP